MGEVEVLQENYWDLMTIKKIIDARNKEYDDEQYELIKKLKESQKKDYSKIFDYRDMIDLAEKHEYKQVRQSGDHIIMQHKLTIKFIFQLYMQNQFYWRKVILGSVTDVDTVISEDTILGGITTSVSPGQGNWCIYQTKNLQCVIY